ncbi:alpha/beta hydrolase [uncultured Mucilaginibacter sp.]|uniref:alpha/beta fold hydrolase n=1 Tax=uncultured Mucilaginibacter sp. TaxID=797541 RepID=UPI0025DE57C4|nr:alpha/beta hydrolase [uncultured Mucilaginibacter sp.]
MKYTFFQLFTALLLIASQACSQQIYSKAYGNPENPAIIYIHGGPRGNATLFEGTTAPLLAQKGFYVIAYDRRGEGRSKDTAATMTFNETITDLDNLMQEYQLKTATILGHSFGGIVATLFTNARPKRVKRLILAGALFTQQETYDHILKSTSQTAIAKKDSAMLKQISYIKTLNHNSAEFRKKCYEIASAYGYFRMPYSTPQSIQLEADYKNSEFGRANIRNDQAPLLF